MHLSPTPLPSPKSQSLADASDIALHEHYVTCRLDACCTVTNYSLPPLHPTATLLPPCALLPLPCSPEAAGFTDKCTWCRFQWYCRFYQGRRTADDERQIGRWKGVCGEKGRWKRSLVNKVWSYASLCQNYFWADMAGCMYESGMSSERNTFQIVCVSLSMHLDLLAMQERKCTCAHVRASS